ncbi:hypothetical protein AB3N60_10265 [Leptospira sp. WS39.C2]
MKQIKEVIFNPNFNKFVSLYLIYATLIILNQNTNDNQIEFTYQKFLENVFRFAFSIYVIRTLFTLANHRNQTKKFRFFLIDFLLLFLLFRILIIPFGYLGKLIPINNVTYFYQIYHDTLTSFTETIFLSFTLIILLNNLEVSPFFKKVKSFFQNKTEMRYIFLLFIIHFCFSIFTLVPIAKPISFLLLLDFIEITLQIVIIHSITRESPNLEMEYNS